ncbi:ParB/RepB/Spo0J family partition protein [Parapusillimonas granuli]|uniref:ParB N-terminal domain-containing protein n=1 Tax=Parapusillimonas granuli TaxID=380911 RepID=A0A853G4C8_9BURK|nr:ParB/RepB/Spo0J family partition protein [Parapusillimonas granuli]MBB5217179.1 ParB family chromosome partitioning protein [Parapusillimonas granuli]NYT51027.1 ParB N-terminal domain-containing protein [Parapusillimonas granuli]
MNAIHQTETQAIDTATQEIAAPAQNLIVVPLSQLRASKRNVRKIKQSIDALAESIARVGLLQNLTVILARDGEHYEVVAGGRRLDALKLLAKTRRIPKDWAVPCLLVADASARTVSLTENVQREAMHPADQFEAFAALVAEGRPIEDIAADFSVTPLVVQRRLKLANVSRRLLADYRADAVTLEQLMALAITDDHAAQEAAFYEAPEWQRQPHALRDRLTEREIDAGHALVRFVGLDAYEAAGGGIRRDLFAQDDSGVYVTDVALLETLVRQKLEEHAATVKAEGWAWVDATPAATYADLQAFQRAPRERRNPTKRESDRMDKLETKMQAIGEAIDAALEDDDEEKADALQEEGDSMGEQLQALEDRLLDYAPNVKAAAGAIITLDRQGQIVVHRGLMREAEAKALRTLERLRQGFSGEDEAHGDNADDGQPKAAAMSDRLAQRLSAHRTAALQIELARNPHAALTAVVHGMVQAVLQRDRYHRDGLLLEMRLTVQNRLESLAPDWPESPAAVALAELQKAVGEDLPQDSADLFAVLLATPQDALVRLLAVCAAASVDVITPRATAQQPCAMLAQAVGLDMAAWWQPTAEGYFKHVSKAVILDAVGEFAPDQVSRLAKLKKTDLASEAERLVAGSGWMPVIFRVEAPQDAAADEGGAIVEDTGTLNEAADAVAAEP